MPKKDFLSQKEDINHLTGRVRSAREVDVKSINIRTNVIERTVRGERRLALQTYYKCPYKGRDVKKQKLLKLKPTERNRSKAGQLIQGFEQTIIESLMRGGHDYVPFSGFAKECLDESISKLAANTRRHYVASLKHHLFPYFMHMDIRDIKAAHMDELWDIMEKAGYSWSTCDKARCTWHHIMREAERLEIIDRRPKLFPKRKPIPETEYYTHDHVKKIFETCKEYYPSWQCFYFMALQSGMRLGELLGLRWQDVLINNRTIQVTHNYDSRHKILGPTKSKRKRTVPIGDALLELLLRFRDKDPSMFHGEVGQGKRSELYPGEEYVFAKYKRRGGNYKRYEILDWTKLTDNCVYRCMNNICKLGKVPYLGMHVFRHTCASLMAQSGLATLHDIQALLGHKSIVTTQRYVHLLPASPELINQVSWAEPLEETADPRAKVVKKKRTL